MFNLSFRYSNEIGQKEGKRKGNRTAQSECGGHFKAHLFRTCISLHSNARYFLQLIFINLLIQISIIINIETKITNIIPIVLISITSYLNDKLKISADLSNF